MLNEYNPFSNRECEETEHGIINYQHDMGTCYVTNRRKEHYFIKYKGFAISKSELEIAFNKRVYWILIMYHREDGSTIPYRMKLDEVRYLEEYNNNGDLQKIIPLSIMEVQKGNGWE